MCDAKVKQVRGGWMVTVNGQYYGEYKTEAEAQQIANSFKGQLAN